MRILMDIINHSTTAVLRAIIAEGHGFMTSLYQLEHQYNYVAVASEIFGPVNYYFLPEVLEPLIFQIAIA